MLGGVEAGDADPIVGAPVLQDPVEMAMGRGRCRTVGGMVAPFGEPAAQMRRVGARDILVDVLADGPVSSLKADQPFRRAFRRAPCRLVARLTVPGRQSMENLGGVESGRLRAVFCNLQPWKSAFRKLHRQQEADRPLGSLAKAVFRQAVA